MDREGDDRLSRNAWGPSLPVEHLREMLCILERHERRGFKKFQGLSILVWLPLSRRPLQAALENMPQFCKANGEIAREHTPCYLRPWRQETRGHKYSLKRVDCCVMLRAFGQPFRNMSQRNNVIINNVGICCVEMLRSFGRGFKNVGTLTLTIALGVVHMPLMYLTFGSKRCFLTLLSPGFSR